jgi:16S rRNA (guanine966-N2)-methyltransferase
MSRHPGRLRIVGGSLKGRLIEVPPGNNARPTGERIREALFSILVSGRGNGIPDLAGARILDAFAGSGALGFEALSRGAGHTRFFDTDRSAISTLESNASYLGLDSRQVDIRRADATRPPPATGSGCDLVFLDPPYDSGMTETAPQALAAAGWIAEGGVAVVEMRRATPFADPPGFTRIDMRQYGDNVMILLKYTT